MNDTTLPSGVETSFRLVFLDRGDTATHAIRD